MMDAGTASAKAGEVAQVPRKVRGEWFVEVDVIEEVGASRAAHQVYRVRIQTSRVSHGVTKCQQLLT